MIVLTDSRGHVQDPHTSSPPRVQASASTGSASSGGAGVAAAQQSPVRGYINPLNRRQKYVLTGQARRTVTEKMRALEANSYGAIAGRVAQWEGPVRPDPDTGSDEYNQELRDFWQQTQVNVETYDLSRKFNAESYQEMVETQALVMGDGLTVFRWDREGWPAVRFHDALSVDSLHGNNLDSDWIDGVKVDPDHAHLAYQILDDASPIASWRQLLDIVDASDAWFHAGFKHPAAVRGVSPFLAAINPMIDLQEIDMAVIELIKVASQVGMSVTSAAGEGNDEPAPVGGPWDKQMFRPAHPAATGAPTDPGEVPVYVEQVMGGPKLAHLPAGKKIELHGVERDIPTYDETRGNTLEKISFALGLPAPMLFGLFTGRFGGSGPGIRLTIGDSHLWRNRRLSRRVPFVMRDYARRIEFAIRKRIVSAPKKSVRFPYRCLARFSEAYTIDIGRNAQEDKVKLSLGALSLKRLAAERGHDAVTVMNERIAELEHLWNEGCVKRGLPQSIVFPDSKAAPAENPDKEEADENSTRSSQKEKSSASED